MHDPLCSLTVPCTNVHTYLANQVNADLLLYLFSSVSSLVTFIVEEQLIKELTNNGDVTDDAIDPLYPGSLFKLPRFVARGLQIKNGFGLKIRSF